MRMLAAGRGTTVYVPTPISEMVGTSEAIEKACVFIE
jgi:hypothetical protein